MRQSFVRYFIVVMMVCLSWAAGQVTKTADTNGTCTTTDCSLREAIAAANNNDTITFNAGLSGKTITLTSGALDITIANLTIDASALANPVTIDANNNSRVFRHTGTGTLTVNNLTIQNGNVGSGLGGGIASIGIGTVTVTDSTISGNTAISGGGIYSNGAITVTDSTISGNTASSLGGGIRGFSDLTLNGCTTIESNTASAGGAQWNVTGTVSDGTGTTLAKARDTAYSPACSTPQTITFAALPNRTYGDAPFTVSATGGASGQPVTFTSATTGVCTTSGTNGKTITLIAAGTCTINADQPGGTTGGTTYAAAPQVQQSFDVDKKALTVTANNVTITEGDTPTFTATYAGFVPGDTAADLDTAVSFADDAPDYNTVGTYTITPSGAADANYTFTYNTGTLTINANAPVINPNPDMQIRAGATTAAESITSGTTINIGAFKRGEVATVDFLIRNPGAKVLEIGELVLPSFLSSAGEPLPETLDSFESALLTLDVNTSAVGALEGAFSLASNDPDANENPFVFTVKGSVSETPANVLNILPGVDLGDISAATGEDDVVLLSFKLSVPAGSTSVTVDSLTLAASNAGIERASNLTLYIDGGTRGELDNRDVLVASTDDTETLTFTFPARTFSPNVPMWFIVVGDF